MRSSAAWSSLQIIYRHSIRANAIIVAHYDQRGAEAVAEELKVLRGGEGREFPGEGKHLHTVHPAGEQQRPLFLQRGQQTELPRILLQDRPGMRPERNNQGLLPPFTGGGDQCFENVTVPEMDPVKETGGYYSHLTHSKS